MFSDVDRTELKQVFSFLLKEIVECVEFRVNLQPIPRFLRTPCRPVHIYKRSIAGRNVWPIRS